MIIGEVIDKLKNCSIKELLEQYYLMRKYVEENANNAAVGIKVVNRCFILICIKGMRDRRSLISFLMRYL